ncbi:MAG: 50S ribosomal protein L33 [Candidatus Sericytochromatia bacterium]|jgi:large subunit ribosomal protein L33|nr:50S ribosomal protein L33 [Candidatus Tanganyikabacteria bacterium]MEB3205238.1 50S ribosomal protein L33 [Candidatus Sericytochromatia bacterium]MEB3238504.1 50S ribosomal protein L33 [Candidatus Sericytochromatia bacterium]MEB3299720.1 50S ribosomal protein L33 [Candidatus Sericytochromatia bacterium]
MAASGHRVIIKLRSTESPYQYTTFKSKRNDPDRLVLKKYDPVVKRHVEFKETK